MTAPSSLRAVQEGAGRLLSNYVGLRDSESVLIAYTPDSREAAAHLQLALLESGKTAQTVVMRPLVDPGFRKRLNEALASMGTMIDLVVFTLELDTMSHFEPFVSLMQSRGAEHCRVFRVIGASDEFFTEALNISPPEMSGLNATLLRRLEGKHSVRLTTGAGTDLEIELDSDLYDWISNRGVWRPGSFTILPAGEIATYPARINGTLIADGAINCNVITRLDMRLSENPLTVEIVDGNAVNFECRNANLHEFGSAGV